MKDAVVRVRYNNATRKWYAVVLDRDGKPREQREPGRSPEGDEVQAEEYMNNYRRYGAWRKS